MAPSIIVVWACRRPANHPLSSSERNIETHIKNIWEIESKERQGHRGNKSQVIKLININENLVSGGRTNIVVSLPACKYYHRTVTIYHCWEMSDQGKMRDCFCQHKYDRSWSRQTSLAPLQLAFPIGWVN